MKIALMQIVDQVLRPEELEDLLKSSFRTTALFELLSEYPSGLSIGEISHQLNIPQSSASTLAKSLSESGYLFREKHNRKIVLTPRLSLLGLSASFQNPRINLLADKAAEVSRTIGETTVIAMRNGNYSQYIYISRESPQSPDDHVTLGSLRPLVSSATGWAMLLDTSDHEIRKLVRSTLATVTDPHWLVLARNAFESIGLARPLRFASSVGRSTSRTGGFAVPIASIDQIGHFSFGVAGDNEQLKRKETLIFKAINSIVLEKC